MMNTSTQSQTRLSFWRRVDHSDPTPTPERDQYARKLIRRAINEDLTIS